MSIVILMDEWPSNVCTTFGVSSLPPADLGLMHQPSEEVPQRMWPEFRFATPIDDASAKHDVFDSKIKVLVVLNGADLRRKYEIKLADRAGDLPLPQFRDQLGTDGHRTAAAIGLRRPYNVPLVGTLAHVKLTSF